MNGLRELEHPQQISYGALAFVAEWRAGLELVEIEIRHTPLDGVRGFNRGQVFSLVLGILRRSDVAHLAVAQLAYIDRERLAGLGELPGGKTRMAKRELHRLHVLRMDTTYGILEQAVDPDILGQRRDVRRVVARARLPGVDVDALRRKGANVGAWHFRGNGFAHSLHEWDTIV